MAHECGCRAEFEVDKDGDPIGHYIVHTPKDIHAATERMREALVKVVTWMDVFDEADWPLRDECKQALSPQERDG